MRHLVSRRTGAVGSNRLDPARPSRWEESMPAKRFADGLTALGIAVLRFDFTGLGSSEGEFANTTFSSNLTDLVAAANELRRRARAPAILIGHSLGGTAVLAAAAEVAEARAVVTIAAPAIPPT